MKNFIYLIGAMDSFESVLDLQNEYLNDPSGEKPDRRNMSVFPVSLSETFIVANYTDIADLAEMLARGEAMTNGWCLEDTFSVLLET